MPSGAFSIDGENAGVLGSVFVELPKQMADLHLHVDRDALDFFCETGRGYQSRVNAVLRSYVERARHK